MRRLPTSSRRYIRVCSPRAAGRQLKSIDLPSSFERVLMGNFGVSYLESQAHPASHRLTMGRTRPNAGLIRA